MHNLTILNPCSISGNCIAETNLNRKLSIKILFQISQNGNFNDFRGSVELGIAKFYFDGRRIRLDENGNVHISNITSQKEASLLIEKIKHLIKEAFI